jgi:hypothetical protein
MRDHARTVTEVHPRKGSDGIRDGCRINDRLLLREIAFGSTPGSSLATEPENARSVNEKCRRLTSYSWLCAETAVPERHKTSHPDG